MAQDGRRDSFLLRIWREDAGEHSRAAHPWRGWIQHVHSGEAVYVEDVAKLIAFVQQWTGRLQPASSASDDSRTADETKLSD